MRMDKKVAAVSLFFLVVVLASCARNHASPSKSFPAESLKYASSVYASFAAMLSADPRDNDFTRFAADPSNYDVVIREDGDGFLYEFSLRDYRGRKVLDGNVIYRVSKAGEVKLQRKL